MNPAYFALIQQLAVAGAQLYAGSKGKDLSGLVAISPLIQAVTAAFTRATAVLAQAQREEWADDDVRWTGPFADADAVLNELEKRMT